MQHRLYSIPGNHQIKHQNTTPEDFRQFCNKGNIGPAVQTHCPLAYCKRMESNQRSRERDVNQYNKSDRRPHNRRLRSRIEPSKKT